MKKSKLTAAVLAIALLTGCGGGGGSAASSASDAGSESVAQSSSAASSSTETEDPAPSGNKAKATIWHTYTEGQQAYLEKAVADFNASQDLYEIDVVSQEYTGFSDTVYQSVFAGNGPDIIIDYASTAATYVEDGKVADLSAYLSDDVISALNPGALEEATSFADGQMHVLPIVFSGPVLFYNPDILSAAGVEVPTTWDEVYEASVKINEASGSYGFAVDSPTDVLQAMIMQNGVTIWDNDAGECKFADEKVYAALDWYGKGVQEGVFLSNPSLSDYFSDDYNAENIAMYVGSVAGCPYLSANWDVAPMPQTAGGIAWTPAWNRGVIVFDYDDEDRVKAAAAFTEYFASPDVNAGWCEACNYLTSFSSTEGSDIYQAFLGNGSDNVKALLALTPENAGSFPAVPAIQFVRNALKNAMADAAAGLSGEEAVQNAIDYVMEEVG